MGQQTVKLLNYSEKEEDFPILSTRFVAMIQKKGLYKSLPWIEEQSDEPAPLANGANKYQNRHHMVLKDAYEMEIPEIKEKWNNVWCHLALTPDATTLILTRQDCVSDVGIRDKNKGLEAFAREISE